MFLDDFTLILKQSKIIFNTVFRLACVALLSLNKVDLREGNFTLSTYIIINIYGYT